MYVRYSKTGHECLEQSNDVNSMKNWSTINCDRLSVSKFKTGKNQSKYSISMRCNLNVGSIQMQGFISHRFERCISYLTSRWTITKVLWNYTIFWITNICVSETWNGFECVTSHLAEFHHCSFGRTATQGTSHCHHGWLFDSQQEKGSFAWDRSSAECIGKTWTEDLSKEMPVFPNQFGLHGPWNVDTW